MSRHRYVHPNRRKKLAAVIAGSAFAIGSAATVTAAAWPAGSAAAADARLTGVTQAQDAVATQQSMRNIALRAENIAALAAAQAAVQQQAAKAAAQQAAKAAAEKAAKQAAAAKAAAAKAAAAKAVAGKAAQQKAQQLTTAENSGTPQQIAAAMLSRFGWSSDQMSCLEPLWQRESGWEVSAYNAGSGAFGIPQALPGAKMASAGADWQTSAATQIKWGLGYIQQVYGSPCGAWDHEEADGWY